MLQILNEIKNNMITINNQQSKIQGYISLHVTEVNDLHYISRHFMLHYTSFHVAFHIISCHISHISLHALHVSHTYHACCTFNALHAFHAYHVFHALHHISRHFMYHFTSFYHENSLHTHSCHLALKREENRSKCQALQ